MAKLTENTTVRHPETGEPVTLTQGDGLPEWAAGLVGEHILTDEKPQAKQRRRKR